MNEINNKKFLIKSFSAVAIANFITKPIWILLFIIAARQLGTYQFGLYTYASSLVAILSVFIDLGFDYIVVRESSKNINKLNHYFTNLLALRAVNILIIYTFLLIYAFLFNLFGTTQFIILLILLAFQFLTYIISFFKAIITIFQDFNLYSKMLILEKMFIIILGIISLFLFRDIISFITSILLANIISSVFFYFVLKNKNIKTENLSYFNIKEITKLALPFFLLNVFISIYFRLDVVLLDLIIQSKHIIGIYGSIHRLIEMYLLIPTILMSTTYPIIISKYKENKNFAIKFAEKNITYLLALSLTISILVSSNSYFFNNLLYGKNYEEGSKGLIILIWVIIPNSINYILGNLLVAVHKEKYSVWTIGFISLFNVVLNYFLIQKFGFIGACITALISEILIFLSYSYFVKLYFGDVKIRSLVLKTVIIILIIFITNTIIPYHPLINIIVNLTLIITMLFLSGIISKKDLVEVTKSLRE